MVEVVKSKDNKYDIVKSKRKLVPNINISYDHNNDVYWITIGHPLIFGTYNFPANEYWLKKNIGLLIADFDAQKIKRISDEKEKEFELLSNQITDKQRKFIDLMEDFVCEKFNGRTKKEASAYISRNIEQFKVLSADAWAIRNGYA